MTRSALACLLPALGLAGAVTAPAAAQSGAVLAVEDAAVRVVVVPENRADVAVQVVSPGSPELPRLQITRVGGRTVVAGGLRDRFRGCDIIVMGGSVRGDWSNPVNPDRRGRVNIQGIGRVSLADLPLIEVRTPMNAQVSASGAVFGAVGRTESLSFANTGCGDWTLGNVRGRLALRQVGSGDIRAGSAGQVEANVTGSGDARLQAVSGLLAAQVVGSGSVRAASVGGQVRAQVDGSGDVIVDGGSPAGVDARVVGSGDVRLASVSGPSRLVVEGSGDAIVNGGQTPQLTAEVRGSGDVRFGGTAAALNASIAGSGDVRVARVTGPISKSVRGSGDVTVGR